MSTNAAVCLLLEDEPLIAMDLELTLGNAGVDVTTVMSCAQASDWLAKCRPDIVVVDIELRDGRSDKVVDGLVEHNIPFIVHSGDHPSMHIDTPFAHGRWVNKPAAPDELVEAVRSLLSH
jgi:DNA-binding response OmpR family regulator